MSISSPTKERHARARGFHPNTEPATHTPTRSTASSQRHSGSELRVRRRDSLLDIELEEVDATGHIRSLSRDSDQGGTMAIDGRRSPFHRPVEGDASHHRPLLATKSSKSSLLDEAERGRSKQNSLSNNTLRPTVSRRTTQMSERSPNRTLAETKRKYTLAAFFLVLSLISFVVQTETAGYIQKELGWNKAYCMLWLTHGSWILLYPFTLAVTRLQKRHLPTQTFWRRHVQLVRQTAQMVESQQLHPGRHAPDPTRYMIRTTIIVACALTVAGASWYVAVNMTSPSDLTAIYNCSAFFAYVFSVPLLKEPLRLDKSLAVLVAIVGVMIVAYGDGSSTSRDGSGEANNRLAGNLIIGFGSILYGLYEVLYKRLACPPEGTSPGRGVLFANTFGSMIGLFTIIVLWIPIPLLHWTGLEPFELPRGQAASLLLISTLSNAVFSGSFLVLISLTSPVLSSVAALLTIFLVSMTDWWWTGTPLTAATLWGGGLIVIAFGVLSASTWREMREQGEKAGVDDVEESEAEVGLLPP